MTRYIFVCYLSLFCLCPLTLGQVATDHQPPAASQGVDSEYQKFDQTLSFLRERNAREYAIDSAKGVDEASYVPIGGVEQWVTIRGEDRDNPILLFLHGGPGDVTNPWSFAIFAPWEAHFTVVQWDQRGAGKTLTKSGPSAAPTMTLDRMTQDGIELAEYLSKHLGKSKVILVAHSFGTILGLPMIQERPDLFFAYVGTGQVADETRSDTMVYEALLKKARATRNQLALDELESIGHPPYVSGQGRQVQHKWSNRFEGADRFLYGTLGLALVAPGYSVRDLNDDLDGQNLSEERLVSQTQSETMKELGLRFAIPMLFFEGTEDLPHRPSLHASISQRFKPREKSLCRFPGATLRCL